MLAKTHGKPYKELKSFNYIAFSFRSSIHYHHGNTCWHSCRHGSREGTEWGKELYFDPTGKRKLSETLCVS